MGKLVVTEFVTLDGVAQAPGEPDEDREGGFDHGGWQAPLLDEESGAVMFEQASGMDALLLGRKTYDIFARYGPNAPEEIPFTGLLNRVPKFVASRTLDAPLGWESSTLTRPNGTLQLIYEAAGVPTYGDLAIEADDLRRLAGDE